MTRAPARTSKMKPLPIILLAVGILSSEYQSFTYTTQERVVDLSPLQATAEKTKTFPLPPILGALAMAGGIGLLIIRKKS